MSGFDTAEAAGKGIPAVEAVFDAASAIGEGNNAGLLGAVLSGGGAVVEAVEDPIGWLGAAGIGWVIEHIPLLKEALDAVSGDPDAIDQLTDTWTNKVADPLSMLSDSVAKSSSDTQSGWKGIDAEAYRTSSSDLAQHTSAIAESARKMAAGLSFAGTMVLEVRQFIRDELAKFATWAIAAWAAAAAASVPSAGSSVVAATNTILMRGSMLAQRFSSVPRTLTSKIGQLTDQFSTLGQATRSLNWIGTDIGSAATATSRAVDEGKVLNKVFELAGARPSVADIALSAGTNGRIALIKASGDAAVAYREPQPD